MAGAIYIQILHGAAKIKRVFRRQYDSIAAEERVHVCVEGGVIAELQQYPDQPQQPSYRAVVHWPRQSFLPDMINRNQRIS